MRIYFCILFWLLSGISAGAELHNIRHSVHLGNLKVVFDLSGDADYVVNEKEGELLLILKDSFVKQPNSYYQILNGLVGRISLKNSKNDLIINIPLSRNIDKKVYQLSDPNRIVVDIKRKESETQESLSGENENSKFKQISEGVLYRKIKRIAEKKIINAHALFVDPKFAKIEPAFAVPYIRKNNFPLLSHISDFLRSIFRKGNEKTKHFEKKRVSYLAKREGAVAGVNGSFFFGSGVPVGTLIVNEQIISSPFYDRTALIIYKSGDIKISRIKMTGYIKLKNGETLPFSGVNQPFNGNEIVIYTPDYQVTDQKADTVNIIVSNNQVVSISEGQINIPNNSIVICAKGENKKKLKAMFKEGDEVKWFFMSTPSLDGVLHAIAGGPRLLYKGIMHISADEEQFRNDVKNSRAARTAVGITKEGNLIFLVVEGNGKSSGGSSGVSLKELAQMMSDLGAYNAMNLDGGGSSTMVINGEVVNSSSERPVSNAILIKKRAER